MRKIKVVPTEKQIERSITDYLTRQYPKAALMKINGAGKPTLDAKGKFKLIPFYNPPGTWTTSISDLLMLCDHSFYAFEVKRPTKQNMAILKKCHDGDSREITATKPENSTAYHIAEQSQFLDWVIKNGGHGGFVTDIKHVKSIIKNKRLAVFYGGIDRW